ncbi:MAG TPA: hypothetical protein VH062_11715 [Polyangiaceae bacterium]|jgi:hypothetical protein|nr:hypothetical protein [Polyangiaceae bacterium]
MASRRIAAALSFVASTALAAPDAHHVKEQDVTLDDATDDDAPADEKPVPEPERAPRPKKVDDTKADVASVVSDPAVWLSLGLIEDAAFVSGSDVCTEQSQVSGGYTCTRASGSQYHGTPLAGSGGKLGGVSLAASRITLAATFRLADKVSAGARLGYAFLGQGPTPDGGHSFLSFSAEANGAYWLSDHAFSSRAVGTFVELSAGLAELDGKGKVTVKENTAVPPPVSQLDNKPTQSLTTYQKAGAGFAGAGAGLYIPFGRRAGLLVDLRVLELFPTSGTGLSLGVSGAFGL